MKIDHQKTAADLADRLDVVAADARKLADDMRAAVDTIDRLIADAGRLRARLEAANR